MTHRLSAVILAAGLSLRMGNLKAALPMGTTTVLEQCIGLFKDCGIEDLVVVTGHRSEETGGIAQRAGARLAHNPQFTSGMYSSIQTGVRHIAEQSSGFFLLPVDIPLVRPCTVRSMIHSFIAGSFRITYPKFDGQRGHPPLIATDLIPAILADDTPEGGLRPLLAKLEKEQPQQVCDVTVADANILFDMDTPEDYRQGLTRFSRREYPAMEECLFILYHLHPMLEKGLAHGRLVANIAVELCQAMQQASKQDLDPELCQVCGWLHDIAKGHVHHEREGAHWLCQLGFARAAAIVAEHKELKWLPGMAITEKEIVYLADKLARGGSIVDVAERFEEKLRLYRDDPEAVRAIRGRYDQALQVVAAIEAQTGLGLNEMLSSCLAPCSC